MSAIEMMDSKMDAGMMFNKDKNILSFKQAVDVGVIELSIHKILTYLSPI